MNSQPELLVSDLLNNLDEASTLLWKSLQLDDWLDAYLLAAGISQVVEDAVHQDISYFMRISSFLAGTKSPASRILSAITSRVYDTLVAASSRLPDRSRLVQVQRGLAEYVQQLAEVLTGLNVSEKSEMIQTGQAAIEALRKINPGLFDEVIRLPSCFRSFDQHPDDLYRLAREFQSQWPDLDRPLMVVGIRTSGSYLAPLLVAYLKKAGYKDVHAWTLRPGRALLWHERQAIRRLNQSNGLALLTDDPPITGKSLVHSIQSLQHYGLASSRLVLLLQVFGTSKEALPALHGYRAVLLPWEEWAVQAKLAPDAVKQALSGLWKDEYRIEAVQKLPLSEMVGTPSNGRTHAAALYDVSLRDLHSGEATQRRVYVKGAGLGYFGQHTLAVERAFQGYLPRIYGFRDGLIFREWLSEASRLVRNLNQDEKNASLASRLAGYVMARHRSLPAKKDASRLLKGTNSTWEVASSLLSQAFGRGSPVAQMVLTDRVAKRLLDVKHPSIIDGNMGLENWFVDLTDHGAPMKIGFSDRDFSHLDLYSYDPVYDLAGLAVSNPKNGFSESLRWSYQEASGEKIDPERWLLYRWVHLWDRKRLSNDKGWNESHFQARLFQDYFSELYFKNLELMDSGWLCAIDVDGVLETQLFGFSQLTPASAISLRALITHGFRPLISTGRSIEEVRERCHAYHLVGGVAEYGAAVYNHMTGKTEGLLTSEEQETMSCLREDLMAVENVFLDPGYEYGVRASVSDADGRRMHLDTEMVARLLDKNCRSMPVKVITGKSQTDFVPERINKATGLRHLIQEFDPNQGHTPTPLVFAMGDTIVDLPMLDLAARVFVPAHASPELRRPNIKRMAGSYQVGFMQAVEVVLNHIPGSCSVCQWVPPSTESDLFLQYLASQEDTQWGRVGRALKLAAKMKEY